MSGEILENAERGNDEEASVDQYDVFLSFTGDDTRQDLTDVLHDHMVRAGLRVFRDSDELGCGDKIVKILPAIKNSDICVPIFSKTFATKKWPLREVQEMVELKKKIMPIFYQVTANDVKLETELYTSQLKKLEEEYDEVQVKTWEGALKAVPAVIGRAVGSTGYTKFCKAFVEEVLVNLKPRKRFDMAPLVGFDGKLESAMKLLDIQSTDDVRYLGIHGMGGIGKTTLAKLIFNRISARFDGSAFLEDVREKLARHGIEYLQERLINSLDPKSARQLNLHEKIKRSFCKKKVLIVLDDIDDWEQIKDLAGNSSWFGSGSRIVVTTRKVDVLKTGDGKLNKEDVSHLEMEILDSKDALHLFSRYAFERESPPAAFRELSIEAVFTTGGLPLTLTVIGSLFATYKDPEVWKDIIKRSKDMRLEEVKERLRISYDKLDDEAKQIFLDIACFFIGTKKTNPVYMWNACEYYPHLGLAILRNMSLIKILDDDQIWMHDQLRDLGRDIVCENLKDPKKRSRIWIHEEALQVLKSREEKESLEGLRLEYYDPYDTIDLRMEEIGRLTKLRFLYVGWAKLQLDFKDCVPNLRWLSWRHGAKAPSPSKMSNFASTTLVILDLSSSYISEEWGGWTQLQNAKNLKVLDLTGADCLQRTPNFPEGMTLERLTLKRCSKLVAIDSSISNLHCLMYLNLEQCDSLQGLPKEFNDLVNLTELAVTKTHSTSFSFPSVDNLLKLKCVKLNNLQLGNFRGSLGALSSMVELDLNDTDIVQLPDKIGGLVELEKLCLQSCKEMLKVPEALGELKSLVSLDLSSSGLVELPSTIGNLQKLLRLRLSGCAGMKTLPSSLGELKSLVELDLKGTSIAKLPPSIGGLENLKLLLLHSCKAIKALPDSIGKLNSLVRLDLSGTEITALPDSIGGLQILEEIYLKDCKKLRKLPESFGALRKLEKLDAQSADLSNGLPMKISGLSSLRFLDLSWSNVCALPSSISQLSHLHTLKLTGCCKLKDLPDLPTSLTQLNFRSNSQHNWRRLSNLTGLTNLVVQGHLNVDEIGSLYKLAKLELRLWTITSLPAQFGALLQLKKLVLDCLKLKDVPQFPPNLEEMVLERARSDLDMPNISGLKNLHTLRVCKWSNGRALQSLGIRAKDLQSLDNALLLSIRSKITLGLHLPESLRDLTVRDCRALVRFPDISCLKNLLRLHISNCPCLTEIPGFGKLKRLKHLSFFSCNALRTLEDPSQLKELESVGFPTNLEIRCKQAFMSGQRPQTKTEKDVAQTLESILVSGDRNFVVTNGGAKVQVSNLLGKNIVLYISALQNPASHPLFPKVAKAYHEIKAKDEAFKVIFIPSEHDQVAFEDLGWLALPSGDPRILSLRKKLEIQDMPELVALGPTGQIITEKGRSLIEAYGSDAYPFKNEHIENMVNGWPEKLPHALHDHELRLTFRVSYICVGCEQVGSVWSYFCKKCDFDLHPSCAFKEGKLGNQQEDSEINKSPRGNPNLFSKIKRGVKIEAGSSSSFIDRAQADCPEVQAFTTERVITYGNGPTVRIRCTVKKNEDGSSSSSAGQSDISEMESCEEIIGEMVSNDEDEESDNEEVGVKIDAGTSSSSIDQAQDDDLQALMKCMLEEEDSESNRTQKDTHSIESICEEEIVDAAPLMTSPATPSHSLDYSRTETDPAAHAAATKETEEDDAQSNMAEPEAGDRMASKREGNDLVEEDEEEEEEEAPSSEVRDDDEGDEKKEGEQMEVHEEEEVKDEEEREKGEEEEKEEESPEEEDEEANEGPFLDQQLNDSHAAVAASSEPLATDYGSYPQPASQTAGSSSSAQGVTAFSPPPHTVSPLARLKQLTSPLGAKETSLAQEVPTLTAVEVGKAKRELLQVFQRPLTGLSQADLSLIGQAAGVLLQVPRRSVRLRMGLQQLEQTATLIWEAYKQDSLPLRQPTDPIQEWEAAQELALAQGERVQEIKSGKVAKAEEIEVLKAKLATAEAEFQRLQEEEEVAITLLVGHLDSLEDKAEEAKDFRQVQAEAKSKVALHQEDWEDLLEMIKSL
ncbi:protein SUPPRESSOR OF npr1-1, CONSTITUTIVE 1-like [Punica granatum]|uniref:Protein SUPPRESSOR OF npr1-1, CONSTITUTIVE 1-like n=1 Tax=Punica granatum TaxID=22663 RepID=A0A6P8CJ49_PUNGR|nr:protein SUPPRESSOR OF npr1-1, CONSTITUTIVE 1-like [Punica granatum]